MDSIVKINLDELKGLIANLKDIKLTPKNTFKCVAALGISFWFYKTLKIYLKRRKFRNIPGPPANGVFGFYFGNFKEITDNKVFPDLLYKWRMEYGETYKFQMFGDILIFTSDKLTVKEILITKDYPKYDIAMRFLSYPFETRFMGEGLVTDSDYESWKQRRAMFNHGFYRNVLMTFVDQFNIRIDALTERLRIYADGRTAIKLLPELNHLTLDAIAQIAFGMNLDSINEDDNPFNRAISYVFYAMMFQFRDPFVNIKPSTRKIVKMCKDHIKFLRTSGRKVIEERLKALQNEEHIPTDILTTILKAWTNDKMDMEQMIDDFITFFVAGQETTANTLAFSFLEIAKNPQIQEKLFAEVNEVLGQRTVVTYKDVSELKYCASVFKEALRLFPPVGNLSRVNSEPMKIGEYNIPANTSISVSTFVNGRLEENFPDPLEFKPERFIKDKDTMDNQITNYSYFPFSLGPRNCIGQNFAQIEGIMVIAKLIQRFKIDLDKTQSFKIKQDITLSPADKTRIYLIPRS